MNNRTSLGDLSYTWDANKNKLHERNPLRNNTLFAWEA